MKPASLRETLDSLLDEVCISAKKVMSAMRNDLSAEYLAECRGELHARRLAVHALIRKHGHVAMCECEDECYVDETLYPATYDPRCAPLPGDSTEREEEA